MNRSVAVGTVSVLLLLGVAAAPAAGGPPAHARSATSFSGSCAVEGLVQFDPAVTLVPGPLTYTYEADGTCSGDLDGTELSDAPVTVQQAGASEGSCSRAETTSPGEGVVTFPDGRSLTYTLEFSSVVTEIDFTFEGTRSGTAVGHGTFDTDRTPPDKASECATGLTEIPMDMTLETESPLVGQTRGRSGKG